MSTVVPEELLVLMKTCVGHDESIIKLRVVKHHVFGKGANCEKWNLSSSISSRLCAKEKVVALAWHKRFFAIYPFGRFED